ncbi:PREDICTED: uncharacterized protein LOC106811793 [Priapulus caudatus]|uniref:Uncharacterized protein LOC106811793 n=1 Tax=Priapulus caudatus TaxID=37621 RepID=A0ABM1EFM8_PRICU|nr:PREDICTED: uncharacterized protein LOC106811793 [Priapulus caudatus]
MRLQLNDNQNGEISKAVDIINRRHRNELDKLYQEAELSAGKLVADSLRKTWTADSDRKEFLVDQAKNITGKKTNTWSATTYRMGEFLYEPTLKTMTVPHFQ